MEPGDARALFRGAIQRQFADIVRASAGRVGQKAAEIGAKRQQLEQYAKGTVPGSDVLLTAFIKWGLRIRIDDTGAYDQSPKWWECGMTAGGRPRRHTPSPVQLPLFKAIEELKDQDMDVRITRKDPGRIRLAVDIVFREKIS